MNTSYRLLQALSYLQTYYGKGGHWQLIGNTISFKYWDVITDILIHKSAHINYDVSTDTFSIIPNKNINLCLGFCTIVDEALNMCKI